MLQAGEHGPPPREEAALCFHGDQLVMHGGKHDGNFLSDTWLASICDQTVQWQQASSTHGFGLAMAGHSLMSCSLGNILVTPMPRCSDTASNEELILWSLHLHNDGANGARP